jgi:hypothetical protein
MNQNNEQNRTERQRGKKERKEYRHVVEFLLTKAVVFSSFFWSSTGKRKKRREMRQ